jgi:phospholipase C
MARMSRREFIRLAGNTVACGIGYPVTGTVHRAGPVIHTPATTDHLATFDYVVVLMMENRSFDNLLSYLYEPDAVPRGATFAGVAGQTLSNPIPLEADQAHRRVVPVRRGAIMDHPRPDPGEEYPHVNTQLYGTTLPADNRSQPVESMVAPFNAPEPLPARAPMNGFVSDYLQTLQRTLGHAPPYDAYSIIMECFPPDAIPVLSMLARQFAVCDHWHAAVPSQTFPNRSFFHAASSSGLVINSPAEAWRDSNTAETLFNRIEAVRDRRLSWKVYFDTWELFSYTGLIHHARLRPYFPTHFRGMPHFFRDVRTGHLPTYTFLEPRILFNHNDMHPPPQIVGYTLHSSVLAGELLIHQVYDAIRRSASRYGNNAQNTLLVITFDEHGGCYDHVPPPGAVPPDAARPAGQMGFRFDRLGVRVPTVLVSAFIEPGTVINTPLQHMSLLKTLTDKWHLGPLTERDKAAPALPQVFTRRTPRAPHEWPVTVPRPLPATHATNLAHLLHRLQHQFLALVDAIDDQGALQRRAVRTVGEAMQFLRSRKMLFTERL